MRDGSAHGSLLVRPPSADLYESAEAEGVVALPAGQDGMELDILPPMRVAADIVPDGTGASSHRDEQVLISVGVVIHDLDIRHAVTLRRQDPGRETEREFAGVAKQDRSAAGEHQQVQPAVIVEIQAPDRRDG